MEVGQLTTSRRARLRAETTHEIKTIALQQVSTGGPAAISLRAIARDMGMTPRAIYTYFASRDDLVTALIGDIATSLADTLEAARDALAVDDSAGRLVAWGQALREWALAGPEGFRLIYGDPVPDYQTPDEGPVGEAALRVCLGLTGLVAAAWPLVESSQPDDVRWRDFPDAYAAKVRTALPDLPPAGVALALRVWGRMHGLVALEIHGHVRAVSNDPAALYRAELIDLVTSLGLSPVPVGGDPSPRVDH